MAASAEFKHVECVFPTQCLRAMHNLTLATNEWGGTYFPKIIDGVCKLSCDVKLIKGTGLDSHPDAKFYTGDDKQRRVLIAVTPFYREVFQTQQMCDGSGSINVFWHTHPLMLGSDETARLSPPSLGDIFAHTVLSNSRNYRQNRQINTTMVMAFEGLYVYSIVPHKFREVMDDIDALIEKYDGWTASERKMWEVGEAPKWVVEQIKDKIFRQLRDGMEAMSEAQTMHVSENPELYDIRGAKVVSNALWSCKECEQPEMNFPMADALKSDNLVSFARNNPLLQHLRNNGFNYDFYPAPFEQDLKILGGHTAVMLDNRSL